MQAAAFHYSKYMKEHDLLKENLNCTYCGSDNLEILSELQEEPIVNLLRCRSCELTLASRFPTDIALNEYYSEYYLPNDKKITNDNHEYFANHVYKIFTKIRNKKEAVLKIIDVVGGNGSISYEAASRIIASELAERVIVTVVDYENNLIEPKDSRITITHIKDLSIVENDYDYVIASAVLEHIPNSKEVLDTLISKLKPKGVVYIRTPYIASLLVALKRINIHMDFTYPGHIYDMGEKFWTKCCLDRSLKIQTNQPSPVETSLKNNFIRTIAAYTLKFPWKFFGYRYGFVGGLEVSFEVS